MLSHLKKKIKQEFNQTLGKIYFSSSKKNNNDKFNMLDFIKYIIEKYRYQGYKEFDNLESE